MGAEEGSTGREADRSTGVGDLAAAAAAAEAAGFCTGSDIVSARGEEEVDDVEEKKEEEEAPVAATLRCSSTGVAAMGCFCFLFEDDSSGMASWWRLRRMTSIAY